MSRSFFVLYLDRDLGYPLRAAGARQRTPRQGWVWAIVFAIIVAHSGQFFLHLNPHGWESNRLLAVGIGDGFGWMMMLNVWGVIWRIQKRVITPGTNANAETGARDSAGIPASGSDGPPTNALLSIPMLFFMAAASHYPMFGGRD